ncbi:MAG: (2Fe-2S)-binding protein [Intestinimonas sp.]|jgi:NAD(P)H-nitrite reductase large subunit|nr:(2Fe-2S)-binding protein [Intestinimonas sp.]
MSKLYSRNEDIGEFVPAPDDDLIICRCEEITKGEIRRAVHDGMRTITEVRRFLRAGMGLCQGQTCGRLVQGIISRELNMQPANLTPAPSRAPMRPIEMYVLGDEKEGGVPND